MKVVGFTFVRNALRFAYPIEEAIQSILPLCDEVVVAVGNSDDNTLALIQSIPSDKIRIIETVWDDSLREGGRVLAVETNKAFDAIADDADWCIYIQGDEVLHESGIEPLRAAMQENLNNPKIEGLLVRYLHFWGNYKYVADSRSWYRREIRIIRNDKSIRSYRDAQGFRKDGQKLTVKLTSAKMFHYGWVRPPKTLQEKRRSSNRFWHSDEWIDKNLPEGEFDYSEVDSLTIFQGTHPKYMAERIKALSWDFTPKQIRPSLKERASRWVENLTGHRLGEYRNYKLVK